MDLKLVGKRALVTGSSSGLGAAIVKLLAAEGAAVVVHGRNESRANAVAEAIRTRGGSAEVALGDLATDAGADAVAHAALAGGPIDILVNNAGILPRQSWMEATAEMWAQTYNSNVISSVRMIQRLVPQMRERHWGRVGRVRLVAVATRIWSRRASRVFLVIYFADRLWNGKCLPLESPAVAGVWNARLPVDGDKQIYDLEQEKRNSPS
jgi:NAD(P)-dependent dehydrogenase (short-subunit alcohol dehydrogenase family)